MGRKGCLVSLAALVLLAATPVKAQDYPNRPIRAIVNPAGGVSDVIARALGDRLHQRIGQPLIIENRSAGMSHAVPRGCATAAPDGYTLCLVFSDTMTYFPLVFKNLPFKETDLEPVTNLFYMVQTLLVSSKLGAKTMDDLIAMSKAKPGTFNYSNNNYAITSFMDHLKKEKGADWIRVPSRGSSHAVSELLSGTSQIAIMGEGNVVQLLKDGQLRPIVMVNNIRSQNFPQVPTLEEIGYTGPPARAWFGMFMPAGTPRPIIDRLSKEVGAIIREPEFKAKYLDPLGLVSAVGTPEELAADIRKEKELARIVIKTLGLKPQ